MKQLWQQLAQRIDSRNLRERAQIFAAVAAVMIFLFNSLVLDAQMAHEKRLSQQVVRERTDLAALQAEIQRLAAEQPADPDAENKARLQSLQAELAKADDATRALQDRLVSPDKMVSLLEGLLSRNGKLRLVSLKTLPASGLNDIVVSASDEKRDAAVEGLYRHGVEITVQGTYFDIMNYLVQLEAMPWQLYWGKARLHVDEHPTSTLTLELYTLSLEKKWLNI